MSMCVQVSVETRGGRYPWIQSYRDVVSCLMWVLGTELESSGIAMCALKHRALSLAPCLNI